MISRSRVLAFPTISRLALLDDLNACLTAPSAGRVILNIFPAALVAVKTFPVRSSVYVLPSGHEPADLSLFSTLLVFQDSAFAETDITSKNGTSSSERSIDIPPK